MGIKWFNICEVLKTVAHTGLTVVVIVVDITFKYLEFSALLLSLTSSISLLPLWLYDVICNFKQHYIKCFISLEFQNEDIGASILPSILSTFQSEI